ncbi:MAG TPA: GYF domain-containing protein [Vicinamibacteria bacterium]
MGGFKVRLGDGSEIGPMDLAALRTWLAQGLVDGNSPVMRPGTRKWVPLATIPELKGALGASRQKAAPRTSRGRRTGAEPAEAAGPTVADRWRVRIVGILLLVAAAAFGYLAWRPAQAAPGLDGAPWLQVALGTVALGLALQLPWDLARRAVQVLLFLVAFALFPLAGILLAQGERGAGLLALGSAWLFVSGLAALLARALGWKGVAVAVVPVLAGAYGSFRFGLPPEDEAARSVREWVSPERRFTDDALGLTLEIPEGWHALRPGNPLVAAPAETRVTLVQPRHGGFAYLVAEPAPRGVATADQYLDRLHAARARQRPGLQPGERSNAVLGTLAGRRLDATWVDGTTRQREVAVAGIDGWMGFGLVAWMPEATATRPDGLEALARGLVARSLLAERLRAAVDAAVAAVPHLSAPAAQQLMAQSEARVLEPDQAFRRSLAALARLLPSLSPAETRELTALTTATYAGVAWKDRARLASYVERVRKGDTTPAEEDRDMAALMKEAEDKLTPVRRLRLQAYYEKAIRAES